MHCLQQRLIYSAPPPPPPFINPASAPALPPCSGPAKTYIFLVPTPKNSDYRHLRMGSIWKKISVGGLYTSLICAIIPTLFPYFLPFWYPYILLHYFFRYWVGGRGLKPSSQLSQRPAIAWRQSQPACNMHACAPPARPNLICMLIRPTPLGLQLTHYTTFGVCVRVVDVQIRRS